MEKLLYDILGSTHNLVAATETVWDSSLKLPATLNSLFVELETPPSMTLCSAIFH